METLTRSDAHQLIDDIYADGTDADMRALAAHWEVAGHWNDNTGKDDWYYTLHDFVDECAEALQDRRASGRNPRDSDDTGLTAWEGAL